MDRRHFLALAGATGVAAVAGVGLDVPSASAAGNVLVGFADPMNNVDATDRLTNRKAKVVREYLPAGHAIPATAAAAGILPDLQAGRNVIYSVKVPDDSAATQAACGRLAADIAATGHADQVWFVIHHEPFPELSAAQFIDQYQACAPAVRAHGIKVGPIWGCAPIWQKGLDYTTYWPGDSICDFLGIDTYPSNRPEKFGVSPLSTIEPLTSFAKSRGKVFGVSEFGVKKVDADNDRSGATAWMEKFAGLGPSARFLSYWNNDEFVLSGNGLVPAYQYLYDHFS